MAMERQLQLLKFKWKIGVLDISMQLQLLFLCKDNGDGDAN